MIRRIITIDNEKCTGCGLCAEACHEGAIAIVNGKAKLLRDDFCDGLRDCLPECPERAISFIDREALPYDEEAVRIHIKETRTATDSDSVKDGGRLKNWPVQIKLAPVSSPVYEDCSLLIAADCTAYAYASFHDRYIAGRTVLIACPKLDGIDYSEKLSAIFEENNIRDIVLTRMAVPCCGGLEIAVRKAINMSGKNIPLTVDIISANGSIIK